MSHDDVERQLLEIPGVKIEIARDTLGWLKVRVQWDMLLVFEGCVADDDWRDVLAYALRYVEHRRDSAA